MSSVSYRDLTAPAAEAYERHFVPAIATPVSRLLLDAAGLAPAERVLDVGCGTGVIARAAAPLVGPEGSVIAVDVAPDMIDVARSLAAPEGAAIDWRVADAAALPVDDASCDVALCQMALMFMPDRVAALREMRRAVRPGGRVVVSTPGAIQPVFEHMEAAIVEHVSADLGGFVRAVFALHDPDAVAGLLRDAGLDAVDATVTTVTLPLPAPADFLWQYINLTPMAPFVAGAPEAAKEAMERQVVAAWAPYVVDGGVRVVQPMVVATGRRADG